MNRDGAPPRIYLGTKTVRWDPTAVVTFILGRTNAPEASAPSRPKAGRHLHPAPDPDRVTVITPHRVTPPASGAAWRTMSGKRRGGRA